MNKFLNEQDYPTLADAQEAYPEMTSIIEVEGGYMAFETSEDERVWLNQK